MAEKKDTRIRREQIAEAALSLIAEHGISAVTIKRVAEKIGLTAPALYRHYADRTAILDAVLDIMGEYFNENLRLALKAPGGPITALHGLMLDNLDLIHRFRAIPGAILSEYFWMEDRRLVEKILVNYRQFVGGISEIVTVGQRDRVIRDDLTPEEIAVNFLGIYGMATMISHRGMLDIDLMDMVRANWRIFLRGISPEGGGTLQQIQGDG